VQKPTFDRRCKLPLRGCCRLRTPEDLPYTRFSVPTGAGKKGPGESLRPEGTLDAMKRGEVNRSTRQIGEAAESYLRAGVAEIDTDEWIHANIGTRPAMRPTSNDAEEVQTLIAFLNTAMQSLHVGLQSCAIFCPTNDKCRLLVQALKEQGIEAIFQTKGQSNFTVAEVRVLTLHSSKGLEFPVVALAGFHQTPYAQAWEHLSDDERGEKLVQARRVIFVGMTRAMKMLLVLVPNETRSALLTGFDPAYWHIE
jgi:superfamily I DNA/RNA helicase